MAKKFVLFKKFFNPVRLFFGLMAAVIAFNTASLSSEAYKIQKKRTETPFYFSGFQFLGLADTLNSATRVGYLTDKDLNDKQNTAQFAQAQYILSPVILDFNNASHAYILLDFSDEKKALLKIKSIGAVPLKKNGGLILAVKAK